MSSESQARDKTIDSQVTSLRERIVADGFALEPGWNKPVIVTRLV